MGLFVGVLSSIINTNFIDPIDYGDVRYVQNILNFVTTIVLFGYFQSGSRLLALSDSVEYSRRIKGVMVIILIICLFFLMISCVIGALIPTKKESIPFLFLVSIPICGNMLFFNYINTTAQGDNQISKISVIRILPGLLYLPLAYLLYSTWGATSTRMILLQWGIGSLIGICVIISTKPLFKDMRPIWRELSSENRKYGKQLYIGSLVMVATNYLAGIFIGAYNIDNSQVGFYTLALTISTPLMQLPSIIGTTYFKKFAKEVRIPKKVLNTTLVLSLLSCLLFIIIIKPLVLFLYNEKYAIVGSYASWLAIGYTLHGLGDLFNRYLGSHGRGKEIRNASIANGIIKILGYSILIYFFNTKGALITTVACSCIYAGCIYYYYTKFTKSNLYC